MPAVVIGIVVFFLRRLRPTTVALFAYRTWRRLPPEQREAVVLAARRNAPHLASAVARRARLRAYRGPPSASRTIRSCSCWCRVG